MDEIENPFEGAERDREALWDLLSRRRLAREAAEKGNNDGH